MPLVYCLCISVTTFPSAVHAGQRSEQYSSNYHTNFSINADAVVGISENSRVCNKKNVIF